MIEYLNQNKHQEKTIEKKQDQLKLGHKLINLKLVKKL